MLRWLRVASKVARHSTHKKHKFGAVVVRGGSVIAYAWNTPKRHAEERVLNNLDSRDLKNATIYVVRNSGTMSKPCEECMKVIEQTQIRKIVYVDWAGINQTAMV